MNKNNHGGVRTECPMIKKRADKWCKDNGYPVPIKQKKTKYPIKLKLGITNFILP